MRLSVRKGHEYVGVFADFARKRVLFATEGKDHQVWLDFVVAEKWRMDIIPLPPPCGGSPWNPGSAARD
jgi:hypothetical protein